MRLHLLFSAICAVLFSTTAHAGLPREIYCMAAFAPSRTTPISKNNGPMIKREAVSVSSPASFPQRPMITATLRHEAGGSYVTTAGSAAVAVPQAVSIVAAPVYGFFFVGLRDGQVRLIRAGAESQPFPLPEKPSFSDRTAPLPPRDEHDIDLPGEAATHVEYLGHNGPSSPTLPNLMVIRASGRIDYYRLTTDHWALLTGH